MKIDGENQYAAAQGARRIVNAEPYGYSEAAIEAWERHGFTYEASSWETLLQSVHPHVQGLIVRLGRRIDHEVLDRFPDLEFVVSATTGHDHLDLDELQRRGIALRSLREHREFLATIPSTAEHTWALLLALARRIAPADASVRKGEWNRDEFRGFQLKGKTLGIVGMGRTGRKVARYAAAFDTEVLYFDPHVEAYEGVQPAENLEELLAEADAVSLHVHLTPDTMGMIGVRQMQALRKGAFLVNTSRGGICDEEAIVEALISGRLRGVATDVLATELEDIQRSPLWQAQQAGHNVLITPHIGGATWDAMHACEEFLARISQENTLEFQ